MMNIFFCVNNAYADHLLVTIISILENNVEQNIQFYILSSDFSDKNKATFKETLKKYQNFKMKYININTKHFENFNLKNNIKYISVETYYRYIIADIAPNLNKALYLDADLVVNGNLNELYDIDLENNYCAGVKDKFIEETDYKNTLGLSPNETYINAGVLLLNLSRMRKDNVSEKLLSNTNKLAEQIEYQDQDIINITFRGQIKEVDSRYNFASSNVIREKSKIKEAMIIHYTGPIKPWNKNCKHKLRNLWKNYYNRMLVLQGRNKETVVDKMMRFLGLDEW